MPAISASGNAKLILFGEHAAVYGYPAAGLPLPMTTQITFQPGSRFSVEADSLDDKTVFSELLRQLEKILNTAAALKNLRGEWKISGSVPRCGGFGSSAALCTALARVVLKHRDAQYNESVHRLAHQLERQFHGTPSGIDTGMSSDSTSAVWKSSANDIPRRIPLSIPEWYLCYGALPRSSSTSEAVSRLRDARQAGDESVIKTLRSLGHITETFINLAESAHSDQRGPSAFPGEAAALANAAQKCLNSLELSNPAMEKILLLAKQSGALGGKLSGAGLGGAFWLCCAGRKERGTMIEHLNRLLDSAGIQLAWPLTPLDIGMQIN